MRSNKGAVTLYVILAMLTISGFLMAIYIRNTNAEKTQTEITAKIKSTYEDYNFTEVYETLKNGKSAIKGYSISNKMLTIETYKSNNISVDQKGRKIVYYSVTEDSNEPTEIGEAIGKWQRSNVIDISSIEVKDDIYLWTKNEDNVTSYYHIVNTMTLDKIYGNSVQNGEPSPNNPVEIKSVGDSTNLIDFTNFKPYGSSTITFLENGLEYTGNWYISIDGSHLIPGKRYYMGWDYETNSEITPIWRIHYTDNTYSSSISRNGGITIPTDKTVKSIFIYPEMTSTTHTTKFTNIRLNEGKLDDYVPYGKYRIPITITGKNLFDISKVTNSTYLKTTQKEVTITGAYANDTVNYEINLKPNTTYTISYFLTCPKEGENTAAGSIYLRTHDGSSIIKCSDLWTGKNYDNELITQKFTTPSNVEDFTRLSLYGLQNGKTAKFKNIQMEEGTSATDYEPYLANASFNIYLDEPLRAVGDVADYIDFKNGKIVRRIKYVKGEKNILLSISDAYASMNLFDNGGFLKPYNSANVNLFMSTIGSYTYRAAFNGSFHWIIGHNYWNMYSPSEDITLGEYFTSIGLNTNVEFIYAVDDEYKKEEDIELPEIPTFYNINNISIGTEVQPKLEVNYK